MDVRDRPFQVTYVPQDNIRLASELAQQCGQGGASGTSAKAAAAPEAPGAIQHPHLGRYFDGLAAGGAQYRPNAYLRSCYPHDYQA